MVLMRVSLFTRRRPNGEKRRVELFSFQPVVVYVVSSLLETKRTLVVLFSSSRHHQEERTRRLERNSLKREKRYDTGEGRDHPKKGHMLQKELFCVFFSLYKTHEKEEKKKKLTHVVAYVFFSFQPMMMITTGRNKSPPLVPPRSCSSTPPRRTLKSWVSRCKTASRMPRRKSLSNRSFRTADRLSTSRRTAPGTLRRKKVESRRTWRDRTLGARRLPVNRASTLCLASKFVYYA